MVEREPTLAEQTLYDTLHSALRHLDDEDYDGVEEALLNSLDSMVGFCNSRWRLFGDVHVNFKDD